MIEIKQKTFFFLSYNELEKIVKKHLGFTYESCAENEWNNYCCYTVSVEPNKTPYGYDDYKKGVGRNWISNVLYHLFEVGVIPEGNYLIEVSW